jgi:hypothetical protein
VSRFNGLEGSTGDNFRLVRPFPGASMASRKPLAAIAFAAAVCARLPGIGIGIAPDFTGAEHRTITFAGP